jgi:hypothetical protein
MERELLAKLVVATKQLLAMKLKEDSVERVVKKVDELAAGYMPVDWIGQPEIVEVDPIEQFEKQVEMLYGR